MKLGYTIRPRESAISDSLKRCAPLVEQTGNGKWSFILNNGSALLVNARANVHWLELDAAFSGNEMRTDDPWQMLAINRELRGLSKIASAPASRGVRLRAEIPLDEEVDLNLRLRQACAGLKAAAGRLHGEKQLTTARRSEQTLTGQPEQANASRLRELCEESGWKFTERSEAKFAIDLSTRTGFYQAMVESRLDSGVSLVVELIRDAALSELSKRALASMLLRASSLIRLGRAVVNDEGDSGTASFETFFQTEPCAVEFHHALSALTLAGSLCGPAAEAMRDEVVATRYLSAQGLNMKQSVAKEK